MPSKASRAARTRAWGGSSRSRARAVSDLPEPLSPTMPSFSAPSVSDTPRTALLPTMRRRKLDGEIIDLDQHAQPRCFGSSTSRKPSPSRLKASEATKIAIPGMVGTHH